LARHDLSECIQKILDALGFAAAIVEALDAQLCSGRPPAAQTKPAKPYPPICFCASHP
jgi:hypothetical protein